MMFLKRIQFDNVTFPNSQTSEFRVRHLVDDPAVFAFAGATRGEDVVSRQLLSIARSVAGFEFEALRSTVTVVA